MFELVQKQNDIDLKYVGPQLLIAMRGTLVKKKE